MRNRDQIRWILLDHYNPLLHRSEPYGNLILPGESSSNLMHVTDLVWIKHILGDLHPTTSHADTWAARIHQDQDAQTGLYHYPPGTHHIDEHATWQSVAALNMLARRPAHRLACVAPLLEVKRFREWCEAYDPRKSHHRFMLAVIAAASSDPSPAWRGVFRDWYDAHQDSKSGFPFHASSSRRLSPAFLLTVMRLTLGGNVPRADRIVRTVLGFQNQQGGMTRSDLPGYMEMDAAFLLYRLGPMTPIGKPAIDAALGRIGEFVQQTIADQRRLARVLDDPHRALAICGTLSVLGRHFESIEPSDAPFPWAELQHYRAPL
ncbi:MAG: hypothetical protein JXQ73_16915 [Phycisphaerae bacterium]|nr:hypothetical protein [Phycisphaerae bacterium]